MGPRLVPLALFGWAGCVTSVESANPAPPHQAPLTSEAAVHAPEVAPLQRHEVEADDGHPLVVWERSAAQPRGSILLVHGRTWSARPDFDLQVEGEQRSSLEGLARAGFAAYAIDLRGYGETSRDASGWITPNRAATDVTHALRWIDERDAVAEPPALLGWSLGSLTAQLVAQRTPEQVGALILYGYPRTFDQRHPAGPPEDARPPARATTREAAAEDFIIPGSISSAAIAAFVDLAVKSDPVKADWRATDQWNELDPKAVRVPVLLIHGERDPYAPVEHQAELFARLGHPDRTWVIVAGGDHAAHLEDSGERWLHAVVSFLTRPATSITTDRVSGESDR